MYRNNVSHAWHATTIGAHQVKAGPILAVKGYIGPSHFARPATSSSDHTRSDTPAAIAGVIRSALWTEVVPHEVQGNGVSMVLNLL